MGEPTKQPETTGVHLIRRPKCRLSRRTQGAADQPWRRSLPDQAGRSHRATGGRAGSACELRRGRYARRYRPGNGRLRFYGSVTS